MAGFVGIDKVVHNLARKIKKIEGATEAGVLTAALHVRGESQKLSPVDTGNLKSSAYSKRESSKAPSAVVGYTAYYAVFVHEINKNYTVGQWKFLEAVLIRDQKKILNIIAQKAKI